MPVLFLFIALMQGATPGLQPASLGNPERVLAVDFTQVRGLRELPDGRVIISDRLDRGVVLADFRSGAITPIGRTGRGPAEYRLPTALSPMPGDSTLLVDEGNQRLAVIGPDLKIHRTFMLHLPGIGTPLGARGVDMLGRYYLSIPGWIRERAGDSIAVVRFDQRAGRVDTLAVIKGYTPRVDQRQAGLPYVLFAPQDGWGFTSDGRVAVVRSGDYRVEWRDSSGRVTTGPPIPFERRRVTMEDRLSHIRNFMASSSTSGRDGEGGLSPLPASQLEDENIRRVAGHQPFAELHAPFEGSPLVAPDGTLWIQRSVPPGESQLFDLVDGRGQRMGQVRMPGGRRLLAVTTRWLYATETDDDGLQRVERYARPGAP
jgi:hypothetical protein